MIKINVLTHYLNGSCHSNIDRTIHLRYLHLKTTSINKILRILWHFLASVLMTLKQMTIDVIHHAGMWIISVTSISGHRNFLLRRPRNLEKVGTITHRVLLLMLLELGVFADSRLLIMKLRRYMGMDSLSQSANQFLYLLVICDFDTVYVELLFHLS